MVTITRRRLDARSRRVRVVDAQWITPSYRRIRVAGDDLRGFDSPGSADHVRLFFPNPETGRVEMSTIGPDGPIRNPLAISRDYTPVAWDGEAGWLDLDFVIHADGVATEWAENAKPGDELGVGGPRGTRAIDGEPAWWLLAGDETAIPAIRRYLSRVAPGVPVRAVVLASGPEAVQPLESPGALQLDWVFADPDAEPGDPTKLLDAVRATAPLGAAGAGVAFVAAEKRVVAAARELLFAEPWGLDADSAIISGYWRHGVADGDDEH